MKKVKVRIFWLHREQTWKNEGERQEREFSGKKSARIIRAYDERKDKECKSKRRPFRIAKDSLTVAYASEI